MDGMWLLREDTFDSNRAKLTKLGSTGEDEAAAWVEARRWLNGCFCEQADQQNIVPANVGGLDGLDLWGWGRGCRQ
jgi:hypothetical protein